MIKNAKKCILCGCYYSNNSHFLDAHGISPAEYLYRLKKIDKLTGEEFKPKSYEEYVCCDFSERNNLNKWLKQQPASKQADYIAELAQRNVQAWHLSRVPSLNEYQGLFMPAFKYTVQTVGGYAAFCQLWERLGLKPRFEHGQQPSATMNVGLLKIDTREKKPLLPIQTVSIEKLDFGDYTNEKGLVYVERKSLPDFISSFGGDFNRIFKELGRCYDAGKYMVILVEAELYAVLNYRSLAFLEKVTIPPSVFLERVLKVGQTFGFQFVFCNGRAEASKLLMEILSTESPERFDLQLFKDRRV